MRGIKFSNEEFYHIYNRGVDKREIFLERYDLDRFFQSMEEFNTLEPIGIIYEKSFLNLSQFKDSHEQLVRFICYCLNPNHYHFILQQVSDRGIEKFMHRLSGGYTRYFNEKYRRTGSLFQGAYKAVHIDSNEYFLHLSAYVNLNNYAHQLGSSATKSSWVEYIGTDNANTFCSKKIILDQFQNPKEYEEFAKESLKNILEKKRMATELEKYILEVDRF